MKVYMVGYWKITDVLSIVNVAPDDIKALIIYVKVCLIIITGNN